MTKVNMQEAKTRLSQLVAAAERGETVLLCRDGEPIAELRALPRAFARTQIDTRDLGPPITREAALEPLDLAAWNDWAAG
jgi:antitoxin (DNA-binding transcriptional repressor) of toxin-antitoxin stability system